MESADMLEVFKRLGERKTPFQLEERIFSLKAKEPSNEIRHHQSNGDSE